MTGQAHYTSAPPGAGGPGGGFRFTAVSPSARPLLDTLHPLTAYTPPPGAREPAACPPAFAYDRLTGGVAVFTMARSTGRDYTGRWGNHFCQVLTATPADLAGLRPVELWDSPLWAGAPAPDDGRELPDPPGLLPGAGVGPGRVRLLLEAAGEPGVRLLEGLLGAVLRALAGEGPGITLVADDTGRVVDWIAAVSYALPAPLAAELTFTTYTGRPEDDRRHLVGTRPRVWERTRGPAVHLDSPEAWAGGAGPCAAARFLADAWARGDLDALDAVADLWDADPARGGVAGLRAACALLAPEGPWRRPDAEALLERFAAAGREVPRTVRDVLAGSGVCLPAPLAARLAPVAPELRDRCRTAVEEALASGRVPPTGPGEDGLAGFVRALAELRPDALGVAPERVRDATARHLVRAGRPVRDVPAVPAVHAALAALTGPYGAAVVAGLLAALEASADLRAGLDDPALCAFLADDRLDPLRTPEQTDPLAAAPLTAATVLRRCVGEPRRAALRLLRLYRAGVLTEEETYDAVAGLLRPGRPELAARAARLPWRRGAARGGE